MRIVTALVIACGVSTPALAQQDAPNDGGPTTPDAMTATVEAILPAPCRSEEAMSVPVQSMPSMPDMSESSPAQQALMASMMNSQPAMIVGMMATDPDVAFVCGMIAHHQAGIDMAKAELANGADDWAKQKAQEIIDAQQAEIQEMTDWVTAKAAAQ